MLRFGRRTFVSGIAWIALVLGRRPPAVAQSLVTSPLNGSARATLDAVVDTIVPQDQDPGALDAGVPEKIVAHLSTHADALALYRKGLELVDRVARDAGASSFGALDASVRERILSSLLNRPRDAGGVFVARLRRDVLAFFWGSVTGQRVVDYRPPLSGYPEYADPPSHAPRRRL